MTFPQPAPPVSPDGFGPTHGPPSGAPDLGMVLRTEYRLILRSIATRGRLIAIGLLVAVSMLIGFAVRLGHSSDLLFDGVRFVNGNIATLVPLAVLVFGAAALGDLIDDGSLVYLWLRPIPSWVHVLAAWAATVTVVVPLVLLPTVAAAAFIDPSAELITAASVGGLVAVASYAGLFVTLGIRFKRALPWGLAYILIWEGFVASAGKTATKLAIRSYVRSILVSVTGVSLKLGNFALVTGIVVPLVAAAVALYYASRRLAKTDVA